MRICEKFINRYVDGELNERQRKAFKNHLAKCDFCKESLSQMLSLKEAYTSLDEPEIPFNFTAKLIDKLEESKAKNVFLQRRLESLSYRLAPVFAAVLLTVAIWAGVRIHNFNVNMDLDEFLIENGGGIETVFENII